MQAHADWRCRAGIQNLGRAKHVYAGGQYGHGSLLYETRGEGDVVEVRIGVVRRRCKSEGERKIAGLIAYDRASVALDHDLKPLGSAAETGTVDRGTSDCIACPPSVPPAR